MRDALLVLLGAFVGFLGSTLGALIIERINLRRRLRLDLYDKYLPEVDERIDDDDALKEALHNIRRAAQLLGPNEEKYSKELWRRFRARTSEFEGGHPSVYDDPEPRERYGILSLEISEQVHFFETYLAVKLAGRGIEGLPRPFRRIFRRRTR